MKLKKYDNWSLESIPGNFQTEPYDSYGEGSFDIVLISIQLNLWLLPWLPWQRILIADRSHCDFEGKIISGQCTNFRML